MGRTPTISICLNHCLTTIINKNILCNLGVIEEHHFIYTVIMICLHVLILEQTKQSRLSLSVIVILRLDAI